MYKLVAFSVVNRLHSLASSKNSMVASQQAKHYIYINKATKTFSASAHRDRTPKNHPSKMGMTLPYILFHFANYALSLLFASVHRRVVECSEVGSAARVCSLC